MTATRAIKKGIRVEQTVTVNRRPEELYRFWRNFENLPCVMPHLESVRMLEGGRSHWVARGPLGMKFEWDSDVINDVENQQISWQSLKGSKVDSAGTVLFKKVPGNGGTEVKVTLSYDPPGHALGAVLARLFGRDPSRQIAGDLQRFKELMETGKIGVSESPPSETTMPPGGEEPRPGEPPETKVRR